MAPIEDDAKFCTVCGSPQSSAPVEGRAAQAVTPAVASSAAADTADPKAASSESAKENGQTPAGEPTAQQQPSGTYQQAAPAGYPNYQQPYQQPYVASYDVNDHTAQFSPQDISDNKIYAMLGYLLSFVGIIVALLAAPRSPYCQFHVRQAVKLLILETLTGIVCGLLFWTLIIPVLGAIFALILAIIQIICFFQVCSGKAKDAPIVRSCNFMK